MFGFIDRMLARLAQGAARRGRPPELDLHGLGVRDAVAATETFLADAVAAGIPEVRIIYGKGRHSRGGRGVLREVIPRWLADEGRRFVSSASPEPDMRAEDAAIRIRLRGDA